VACPLPTPPKRASRRLAMLPEAAEYGCCSAKTIRRMIASGRLTGYRMGPRLLRVDLSELDNLLTPVPTTKGG
jgi:excisionase family DNA binding protein